MVIRFSPFYPDDQTIYSGSKGFLLISTNGGAAWNTIPLHYSPLRKRILNKLIALGLPRGVWDKYRTKADTRPVYPVVIAPSPDYASDSMVLFGTRWHGMYRSDNAGYDSYLTWEKTDGAVTSLSISPNFKKDGTAFIYVRGDGIYKTNDRGISWNKTSIGLPFNSIKTENIKKLIEHNDFEIVFSPEYSTDKTLFTAGPLGLFNSTDEGKSWNRLASKMLGDSPNVIAIDISPNYKNDKTLLISLKGRGLYKSVDGATSFFETGKELIRNNSSIEIIAFSNDYQKDRTIYAASDISLFRSTNDGNNWARLQRPVRYENHRDVIRYAGDWVREKSMDSSASSIHVSETIGGKASLDFFGCGVKWIATRSPQGGAANVYIDNNLIETVDLHTEAIEPLATVFSKTGLACNAHTITIEVANKENSGSAGRVVLDAFDIELPN
jgi:hypothetical protein